MKLRALEVPLLDHPVAAYPAGLAADNAFCSPPRNDGEFLGRIHPDALRFGMPDHGSSQRMGAVDLQGRSLCKQFPLAVPVHG